MADIQNLLFMVEIAMLLVFIVVKAVSSFINMSRSKKVDSVKEWLKYAVTQAEIKFGSGTGQLKLRSVYNLALGKFPWLGAFVSFDTFSLWVDEALDWLNKEIDENESISKMFK